MSVHVLKVIVVAALVIGIAIAFVKLIPFLILGAGGYVLYKLFIDKKPPTNP